MKKSIIYSIIFIAIGFNLLPAQDNVPYLTDDDIIAIETVLREDTVFALQDETPVFPAQGRIANEISRLNLSHSLFHLLILDRANSPNSDIIEADNMRIIYKYRHGINGYLIALYESPADGPVFPQIPANTRILVNLSTVRPNTLIEYFNSNAFRRFVSNSTILSELEEALRDL